VSDQRTLRADLPWCAAACGRYTAWMGAAAVYIWYLVFRCEVPPSEVRALFCACALLAFFAALAASALDACAPSRVRRVLLNVPALTLIAALSLITMYLAPLSPLLGMRPACAASMLFAVSFAASDALFWAETSSKNGERLTRPARARACGLGCASVFTLVCMLAVQRGLPQHLPQSWFWPGAVTASALLLVLTLTPPTKAAFSERLRFKAWLGEFLRNDQLLALLGIAFCRQLSLLLAVISVILFALWFGSITWLLALFAVPGFAALCAGLALCPQLCRIFSERVVFLCSCVLMAAGFSLILLTDFGAGVFSAGIAGTFALGCFGAGLANSLICAMASDCADYGEFRSARRLPQLMFSVQTAASVLGGLAALAVTQGCLTLGSSFFRPARAEAALYAFRSTVTAAVIAAAVTAALYVVFWKLHGRIFSGILQTLERTRVIRPSDKYPAKAHPLRYALNRESVLCRLKAADPGEALCALCGALGKSQALKDPAAYFRALNAKLKITPAGIAEGIALPHVSGEFVARPALAVATLARPLDFKAGDGRGCDVIFMIATPDDGHSYITLLGQLSLLLGDEDFSLRLRRAQGADEIADRILQCEKNLKL
jgi:mannitol/fructose-specific phosphotransferase system IIA component (Ntr-type)/Na+/melibiose symporter-like transporter